LSCGEVGDLEGEVEYVIFIVNINRKKIHTALPDVMRYKNPTPNPLPASEEGAMMYPIRAETAVAPKTSKTANKNSMKEDEIKRFKGKFDYLAETRD
jgi:hypothetical protein